MKSLIYLVMIGLLFQACNFTAERDMAVMPGKKVVFEDYRELEFLEEYTKVSDTSVWAAAPRVLGPTHRLTHFKKSSEDLIVFSKVYLSWENDDEIRVLLDTLKISHLKKGAYITIGYCYNDKDLEEQIIAVVDSTENDTIQNIRKIWKADLYSESIVPVADLEQFTCFREYTIR